MMVVQPCAASTVETSNSEILEEDGCGQKRHDRNHNVNKQRKFKKPKLESISLMLENNIKKNDRKKKMNDAARDNKKNVLKPSSDMVNKMHSIAHHFEGSVPEHFFSKIVTNSDTQRHHNRFLLPTKANNLTEKLKGILTHMGIDLHIDGDGNMELPVVVVDRCKNTYNMKFRYLKTNGAFRIIGKDYINFVRNNELKCNVDAVHVWIFHVKHGAARREVWLGLIKEELPMAPVMALPLSMALPAMKVEGLVAPVSLTEEMKELGVEENVAAVDDSVLQAAEVLIMLSQAFTSTPTSLSGHLEMEMQKQKPELQRRHIGRRI